MKRKLLILPLMALLLGTSACQQKDSTYLQYKHYIATLNVDETPTYEEWLESMRGEDGEDGQAPEIKVGSNGHIFVNGVDTGVNSKGAKGADGPKGEKGDKGETGDNAITPYELYKSLHPDYEKSEFGFYIDLANGGTAEQTYHSVKFVINDNDMLTLQILHGEKVNEPDFTALEGVSIAYWTYQGEVWNFNASVTEDMVLLASLE